MFGQSFYVQCQIEWSNARAGAHILAQISRFLQPNSEQHGDLPDWVSKFDRVHAVISDLIDLLVDCDREFVRMALGVSEHNKEEEKGRPYRNPSFDASVLFAALEKQVMALLRRLPFEIRLCTVENVNSDKVNTGVEEIPFPFSLNQTIGNFVSIRNAVILQWRDPPIDKKHASQRSIPTCFVMYGNPRPHIPEASAGIDLGFCLTEFCKVQKLPMSDNWKCRRCKVIREGNQNINLWRFRIY